MFLKLETKKMSAIKAKNDKGHFCHIKVINESIYFLLMDLDCSFFVMREVEWQW